MLLIYSAVIGVVVAWLAGRVLRGNGYGLPGNVAAGILGAVFGGSLLRMGGMDLGGAVAGTIFVATVGSAIVLFFVHFFTGRRAGRRLWS